MNKKIFLIILICLFVGISTINAVDVNEESDIIEKKPINTLSGSINDFNDSDKKVDEIKNHKQNKTQKNKEKSSSKLMKNDDVEVYFTYRVVREAGYRVRNYVENHGVLPDYVTITLQGGEYKVSMPDFLYIMANTVRKQYEGGQLSVSGFFLNHNPENPRGNSIYAEITKDQFYQIAYNTVMHMSISWSTPEYIETPYGDMQYQTVVYMFSRIMHWMYLNDAPNTNAGLPLYVTINVASSHSMNQYIPKGPDFITTRAVTYDSIREVGHSIFESLEEVPVFMSGEYVILEDGRKVFMTIPEVMNYILRYIIVIYENNNLNQYIEPTNEEKFGYPEESHGDSINAQFTKAQYYDIAKRILAYAETHGVMPNYVTTNTGQRMQYETYVYMFSKILNQGYMNNSPHTNAGLPSSVSINIPANYFL